MASKEEVKKLIQEKGSLVSTEGATTTVTTSDGRVITGVPYSADIGVSARTGATLFEDEGGSFSLEEPSKTTISLDKTTGKISVKVPSFIFNRDTFKTDYMDLLKTYSANYKADSNRRYVDYENDASEGKTTEEVLAEMQDAMNSQGFIDNAKAIQASKDYEENKTGYKFTDDEIIRRNTIAIGPEVKDDSVQVIPLDLDTARFSTYDKTTGGVQLGDLREHLYNREIMSDEELLDMYAEYSDYVENGYKDDTSTDAKEKYIRASAFVDFMDRRSPDVGVIRGFGDIISQFMYGAASTAAELEALAVDLFTGATGIRKWSDEDTVLADTIRVQAEHEEKSKFLNANSYAFNVLGEVAVHIINSIAAGQIAEGAISGISEGVKGALAAKIGATTLETATGLSKATDVAVKTSKAIQIATEAALWLSSGTKAANFVNTAVQVLGTVGSAVSEALASGVLEAVVNNPALFEKVLSSRELTDEARSAVMEEFAWNIGGWGAGITLEGALLKFGETLPGRVLSDNLAIVNAKIQTKTGEIADAIKVKFSKYDTIDELIKNIPNADKRRAGELQQALRWKLGELATEEPIQAIGKNADEIDEALKRVDAKILEVRDANNALTDFQASVSRTLNSWFVKNLGWRNAYTDVTKKFNSVVDAEKAAGIASKATNAADVGVEGKLFSQVTTNYIGAINEKVRVDWLIRNQGETPELLKASDDIAEKISEFRKVAPEGSDLSNAVADFIVSQRAAYYQMTNMFIRPDMGLENRAEIEYYRASGQWGVDGADYAYAMRKGELSEIQKMNKNGTFNTRTFVEDMHYSYGATGDYVDPMLAMQTKLIEHAKVYQRRQLYKAFGNTDMVNRVVRVSAEQTEMVRIVTPKVRKNYRKAIYQWTAGQSENLILDGLTDVYVRMGADVSAIAGGKRATKKATKLLGELPDKTWTTSIADRTGYVLGMSSDEITDGMDELFGIRAWSELTNEDFENFYKGLDAGARKYLANQMSDFSLNYLGQELANNPSDRVYVFRKMLDEMQNGDDVARGVLANTKSFRDSDWVTTLANATKTADRQAEYALKYADELEELAQSMKTAEMDIDRAKEEIEILIEDSIGRIINGATSDKDVLTALKPILAVTGDNLDSATKSYTILDTILRKQEGLRTMAYEAIAGGIAKPMEAKEIAALQSQFFDLLIKRVNDVRNNLADQLRAVGSSLPDTADIFKQVRDTMSEIQGLNVGRGVTAGKKIIVIGDQNGALQYVEVNPLFAELMNTQPVYKDMGKIQKLNYMWSKLWRMGTTSMSLKSLVNQQFKDSINAFVGGGAYQTFKQLAPGLTDVFGADIVEYFRTFEPDNLVYLTKRAEETGEKIEKVATEELLSRGKMLSSESLETKAYQLSREIRFAQFVKGESEAKAFDKAINKLDDFMNSKFSPNRINDWREGMLRTGVYQNALATGLKRGYSVEQATVYATQLMDDATTNFTRSMYHLQSLQKTVPYLGAAVNGTKSFWRLASLDPVGVFSRLIGGAAVPVMAVTSVSLASEEDRKVWKNLKEYEKDGNLVFVTNGQVFTIPLPEEVSNFVNPFRQVVEGLSGAANHSFWELAANDIIDISPIDFTGFTQTDAYTLGKDPTVWDRLGSGTLRLMSQLLPPPLRASATVISGRDLYTGADIDRTYKQYNVETGEAEVMGDYSGQFARAIAKLFGDQVSAPMIEELFSQIAGTASVDFLDVLANYGIMALATEDFQEQVGANWLEGLARPIERITGPLIATPKRDLAQAAWGAAMSEMYNLKTEMANSEEYLGIVREVNDAYASGNQEKIYAANNRKRAFLEPFYARLKQTVDDLNSQYGADFTARKYASVLSVANFASETSTLGSAYSSQVSKQLYYEGKQQAIATMQRLGFGSANSGIFGWIRANSAGDIYVDYATPMAILNGENMAYYSQNTFASNLETQLSSAGITRPAMFGDDYNKAKADKAALKQYKSAWNTKVVMALAPYIRRYGVDTVLNDTATIDMLDQYIFVDNPYKAKDYIKTIFKGAM